MVSSRKVCIASRRRSGRGKESAAREGGGRERKVPRAREGKGRYRKWERKMESAAREGTTKEWNKFKR